MCHGRVRPCPAESSSPERRGGAREPRVPWSEAWRRPRSLGGDVAEAWPSEDLRPRHRGGLSWLVGDPQKKTHGRTRPWHGERGGSAAGGGRFDSYRPGHDGWESRASVGCRGLRLGEGHDLWAVASQRRGLRKTSDHGTGAGCGGLWVTHVKRHAAIARGTGRVGRGGCFDSYRPGNDGRESRANVGCRGLRLGEGHDLWAVASQRRGLRKTSDHGTGVGGGWRGGGSGATAFRP